MLYAWELFSYSPSSSTSLTIVAKCCDVGQVYHEKESVCGEGNFNLTALRSKHLAEDDIGFNNNEVAFDTGAVKAEDCENGSLRY